MYEKKNATEEAFPHNQSTKIVHYYSQKRST